VEPVQVQNVETADHRAVQQDGVESLQTASGPNQADDLLRRIPSVHAHATHTDGFDTIRGGDRHGRDGRPAIVPMEGPVIDADDSHVELGESRTQG
jgi:hypothetical protein